MSMELITAAFIMGLAGSLHCLGMCGPLAMSLPVSYTNNLSRFTGGVTYNLGRIVSYATLGLLSGSIGRLIIADHWQSRLSLLLGTLIIVSLLVPKKFFHVARPNVINRPVL